MLTTIFIFQKCQIPELFKKWETYRNGMEDDAVLEAFIYGYCLNKELDLEKNKYKQS